MTENKRFTVTQDFEEPYRQIRENEHVIMGGFIEAQTEPIVNRLNELHDENKELQERNQRQAETIRQLYNLIENKDWETLTAHLMELKKVEEQLQSEWQTYSRDDVE